MACRFLTSAGISRRQSNLFPRGCWLCASHTTLAFYFGSQLTLIPYRYNLIQPVPIPGNGTTATNVPRVQAAYYGALMVAEAIGTGPNTKVAELSSNSTSIAAYGIWENERLTRAVIINSDVYFAGTSGKRSSQTVELGGYTNGKTSIRRLTAPGANSTEV